MYISINLNHEFILIKDKSASNEIEELAADSAKRLNAEYWPVSSLNGNQ